MADYLTINVCILVLKGGNWMISVSIQQDARIFVTLFLLLIKLREETDTLRNT